MKQARRGAAWALGAVVAACGTGAALAQSPRQTAQPGEAQVREAATARQVENLAAFARLSGWVRWFHASDGAFDTNWDALAPHGVGAVVDAPDAAALREALQRVFGPIAPTMRLFLTGEPAPAPAFVRAERPDAPLFSVAAWRHEGLGIGADASGPFQSSRVIYPIADARLRAGFPDPNAPLVMDLGGGVSCLMPSAVMVSTKTKTVPAGEPFKGGAGAASLFNRDVRLGIVVQVWSAMREFWPYFGEREVDWDAALRETIAGVWNAPPREFMGRLRAMVARTADGQADVYLTGDAGEKRLPVEWRWAEGQLVITKALSEDAAKALSEWIGHGAIAATIGGEEIGDALARAAAQSPGATPESVRERALESLLAGPADEPVRLQITPLNAKTRSPVIVELRRTASLWSSPPSLAEVAREEAPGVLVVRARGATPAMLGELRPTLAAAKRIVFDLRSASPISVVIGSMLDEAISAPTVATPIRLAPDQGDLSFEQEEGIILPQSPRVGAAVVFVADARTMGEAERDLLAVREAKLGPIVGERTAGTAGEVIEVPLGAGMSLRFTGRMTRRYDGEPLFGAGVTPDVIVAPTIAGLAAGRDEALERAIEMVKALPERPAPPASEKQPKGEQPTPSTPPRVTPKP